MICCTVTKELHIWFLIVYLQIKAEVIVCKSNYEALNLQLLEDLPKFYQLSISVITDCLRQFILIQEGFWLSAQKEILKLLKVISYFIRHLYFVGNLVLAINLQILTERWTAKRCFWFNESIKVFREFRIKINAFSRISVNNWTNWNAPLVIGPTFEHCFRSILRFLIFSCCLHCV